MEFETKSSRDFGLFKEFREFLNNWHGRSIKEAIFDHENEVTDERFLPFQESPPTNISSLDLHGFVLEWTRQILHNLNCPPSFTDTVARLVIENYYTDFEVEPDRNIEAADVLWSTLISQVDSVLQQLSKEDDFADERWNMLQMDDKYSVFAIKNGRRTMEDVHVVIPDLNTLLGLYSDPPTGYYAVFDGHAGNKAACFAATHLHNKIANIPIYRTDVKEAIRQGIRATDESFLSHCNRVEQGCKSGCTAICCFIRPTKLWLAWVGDSQGVVFGSARKPLAVTLPHKPEREDERERIENLGGCVVHMGTWRVNGTLAVSRAIGDIENKPYITSEPDIVEVDLKGEEDFVLLACDGMWDVLNDDDVANIAYSYIKTFAKESDGSGLAAKLVAEAKIRGSSDNITIVVVFLKSYAQIHQNCLNINLTEWVPESPLSQSENGLKNISELMEARDLDVFTAFNQMESPSFQMENFAASMDYIKSDFSSQKWSTATNEQTINISTTTKTVSTNGNDFDDFSAQFSQTLQQSGATLDEADFSHFDSSTFYNKNIDIENPLRDVFEVTASAPEFTIGGVSLKHLEEGELVEKQLETGKFDNADIINWNEEKIASNQLHFLENFESREDTKSASPKPYFESNLSPDAEPFVSRYAHQNQAFVNDCQQEELFDKHRDDFQSNFSSHEESTVALATAINEAIKDEISEPRSPFDDLKDAIQTNADFNPFSNELNDFVEKNEYANIDREIEEHRVVAEDTKVEGESLLQDITRQVDVMVPEVKLVYSEGGDYSESIYEMATKNVASPIKDVNPFELDSLASALPTDKVVLKEEITFDYKNDFRAVSPIPEVDIQQVSSVIEEVKEHDELIYNERFEQVDQHELYERLETDDIETAVSSSIKAEFHQLTRETEIVDDAVAGIEAAEQQHDLNPFMQDIQSNPFITQTESLVIGSPTVEIETPIVTFEHFSEVKQPILEALSTAEVEDDESEDGEGWKFYPTEATASGVPSGGIDDAAIQKEAEVALLANETIAAPAVTENQAFEVKAPEIEPAVICQQVLGNSLVASTVESVVSSQVKTQPKAKAAGKPKVPPTKSTTKVEVLATKAPISKPAPKPTTTSTLKDTKKPTATAKAPTKATASATTVKAKTEAVKLKPTSAPAGTSKVAATAGVTVTKKPLVKPAQLVAKRLDNGLPKDAPEKPKPITKPSEAATKTTVKKTTTVVKSTLSTVPKDPLPIKKPIPAATKVSVASRTLSTTVPAASKTDPKQAKDAVNKNLSGARLTSRTVTSTTATKLSTNGTTKVETSVTSKVTSTSNATKTSTTKSSLVNGSATKELSPSKTKILNSSVGAAKSSTPIPNKSSPKPSTSTRSPNKLFTPIAKSSPLKTTSPTTPKARALNSSPKTPLSAVKSNRQTSTSTTKTSVTKKVTSIHVEKGTIDAQSKEIGTNQISIVKNGDCSVANGGKPNIELELQNGFGKLGNGIEDEIDYNHVSANGSIIDTALILQGAGDDFLA